MTDDLADAYHKTNNRLILLDYDGTLTDFQPNPQEAKPSPRVLNILLELASDPHNTVVIVSGRDKQTLNNWLGHLPLWLIAEHGYFTRAAKGKWTAPAQIDTSWKEPVKQAMTSSTEAVSGSFIEEKETAVVWHNRKADNQAAKAETPKLLKKLRPLANAHNLIAQEGNRMVETRLAGITKGTVAQKLLTDQEWEFILAAGDDATDEDMFAAMPPNACTIKVGDGRTHAKQRVANPAELLDRLTSLL